jgi:hypothetical protein
MKDKKQDKRKVAPVAGFDRGPKDFFRASTGQPWKKRGGFNNRPKDYLGFRRGSR